MAADGRRRSRSTSIGSVRGPTPAPESYVEDQGQELPLAPGELGKKAAQYVSTMKRPNMHIAVHYTALAEEYGLPINMNLLVGEDKRRAFKKMICTTNHRHPEKDLLTKENLCQTIRLLLADAFKYDDPSATQLIKDI
ncbi:hypothetical protein K3495_g815 [Podosphaera aphanis]|nr:hypothetical protein K3495_g815 [Podosphaera aphanis]